MTFNGTPIDLDVSLDTPRHFLNGGVANFTAKIETEFARLNTNGQFTESEKVIFDTNVDGDISDMKALVAFIPQEIPYSDLLNEGKLSGDFAYNGDKLTIKNSDLSAKGDLLDAAFSGDATIYIKDETPPSIAGRVSADVKDVPQLAKALEQDIDGIELVQTANLTADLTAKEKGFLAENISAKAAGDGLNASYKGQADIGEDITAQGSFTANAQNLPNVVSALKLELEQEVIVNTADVSGQVNYTKDVIDVTLDKADVTGQNLAASYQGTVGVRGKAVTANGNFTSDLQAVPSLLTALKVDVPQAGVLDRVKAAGSVNYSADAIALNLSEANLNSADLVASYQGTVNTAGEKVSAKGVLSQLEIPSLPRLAQKAGVENSAASAIGRVKLDQPVNVDYNGSQARLDNLSVSLSEGALNGGFTGNVTQTLGENSQTALNGSFRGQAASLRNVAQSFDVELPASRTSPVFERFETAGNISGDLNNLNITLNTLNVDALKGNGAFVANMAGSKPKISGTLKVAELDARPYQAAYAPAPGTPVPTGWSKTPINVDFVKKFNADVKLSAGSIQTSSINFGQSDIHTVINNNKLTMNFPNMTLYGGSGAMNLAVDAGSRNPVLDMDLNLSRLDTESALSKFASFASATGIGGTNFQVRGAGLSMDSIMRSLNGGGEFGVREGAVKGIDMVATLNGLTQGLNLQSAVAGLGANKITQFNDLIGKFTLRNGVMLIDDFDFNAVGIAAEGGGSVDLGNRSLDFKFKPRLTTSNANSFARAGIPLRVSGSWSSPKTGLDEGAVSSLVAAQAQSLIQDQLGGALGGQAGSILGALGGGGNSSSGGIESALGGILGGSSGTTSGSSGTTSSSPTSVLGGILGGSQSSSSSSTSSGSTTPQAEQKPEDLAIEALGGLFGKKKKKKK